MWVKERLNEAIEEENGTMEGLRTLY
jgi:hypothetical protein